ncbi:MAG: TonB family protein [Gemmatimonadota bacterium]
MLLNNLIESRRARRPLGLQGLVSFGLHVGLGIFVVTATRSAPPNDPERMVATPIALAPPDHPDVRPALPRPEPSQAPLPTVSAITIAPVTDVPDSIPPVVIGESFDPKLFSGGIGPTAACPPTCASNSNPIEAAVFREDEIDEPARVLSQPAPRFPPVLRAAGRAGRVTLQFIVDTAGHVEPGSVRVVEASDPGFEASATDVVLHSRFVAGKSKGQAVRQLMSQTFSYRINAQ